MIKRLAVPWAVLAAALYALSAPFSKLLLNDIAPTMMAAFLYLGAGTGMAVMGMLRKESKEKKLTGKDLPFAVGMVLLDIAAPVCLMTGLTMTTAANASLLNNFEIVTTTLIAAFIFREKVTGKLVLAIILITISSMILSFEDASSLDFSLGSVFVLLACVCWGFENNCTRAMSAGDPLEIVVIKGFGSGFGSLVIALVIGESFPPLRTVVLALILGFIAYGLSIFFYVHAQRNLGAARTSAYYAIAPFIGVFLSLIIFREIPGYPFWTALMIMAAGTYLASV